MKGGEHVPEVSNNVIVLEYVLKCMLRISKALSEQITLMRFENWVSNILEKLQ